MQSEPAQPSTTAPREPGSSGDLAPAEMLYVAAWFGLLMGLAEVAIKAVQKFSFSQIIKADEAVQKFGFGPVVYAGKNVVWMAPLAGLLSLMIIGLILLIIGRWLRRLGSLRLAVFVFSFLGLLNLMFLYPRLHQYAMLLLAAGGALQISRLVVSRAKAFHRLVHRTVWLLIGVVAVSAIAVHGGQAIAERRALAKLPPAPPQAPNVLLIVLDTVRAHNLSLYGYQRATTPNLEALASRGVVFERALSTAPWTLSSHAGMFTGRFPHEMSADWKVPFDETYPTLAEQFSKQGYLTAGFVANTFYCSYEHGLDRGFIHYEDYRGSFGRLVSSLAWMRAIADDLRLRRLLRNDEILDRQSAEDVNGKFLKWLGRARERPFFVFLNYYDAHEPYLPPQPFDRKFGPGRRLGKHSPLRHLSWNLGSGRRTLTPPELQEEVDAYDGAIAYLDQQLGRLFAELRERGVYDNTLIIVTSDHGEEFGEHGLYDHGNSLYLPSVHVPLLISFPPRAPSGRRIAEPVTLRDLAATVAELSGLPARFPGQSLTRHWAPPEAMQATAESPLLNTIRQVGGQPEWFPVSKGDMQALMSEGRRYIRNGDGSEELYDFERDPWERNNLAGQDDGRLLLERFRTLLGQNKYIP